jgi:hypothetical protein
VAGKTAKSTRSWNEVQLDFPFVAKTDFSADRVAEANGPTALRVLRATGRPRGFTGAITSVQTALLGASLEELSAQMLPLLEFCEAAMTRALDAVSLRGEGLPFSPEEYRSLRGIGQAQWLLAERQVQPEAIPTVKRTRKGKKTKPG